ncbi:MAG TPA: PilZ domain-containing protein [Thermoanaerobaculia bacterium]
MDTQRKDERVSLLLVVPARANGMTSSLINASMRGIRLVHSEPFLNRRPCAITLEWEGHTIRFLADPRWTNAAGDRYESGFEIMRIDAQSKSALRALVNAALPSSPHFDRHELLHGVWITTPTRDPAQPASGFTVATTESQHTIDFLRAAYSRGNRELRERVRKMAEFSIEHPGQRYDA